MTFQVTVDPNNAFHYVMSQYAALLPLDIEAALVAGADLIAAQARTNMTANGNVDRGYLLSSIGTISRASSPDEVDVLVGPSFEMYPDRDKTYNDIGYFLEYGATNGGVPWTWFGPAGSRWEGPHFNWRGSHPHPFMVPAKDAMASSVVDLVKQAVGRRW
jgi:hypothetical protein